LQKIINIQL